MAMTTIIIRTITIFFPEESTEGMKGMGYTKKDAEAVGNAEATKGGAE